MSAWDPWLGARGAQGCWDQGMVALALVSRGQCGTIHGRGTAPGVTLDPGWGQGVAGAGSMWGCCSGSGR